MTKVSKSKSILLLSLVILIMLWAGIIVYANRFYEPAYLTNTNIHGRAVLKDAGASISLLTWNIGYAGMGAESDFVLDKGNQRRPLSRELVEANLSAIRSYLAGVEADVIMLQEVAKPSWVTYQVDVLDGVESVLPSMNYTFAADVKTRFVPPPFRVEVGNATFSRVSISSAEMRGLPLETVFQYGLFRKGYRMHVLRTAGPVQWVVVNIHLSAFEPSVRLQQVKQVITFAQEEYALGHHVVIGGDWNYRLSDTEFLHSTDEEFLFWIQDFPEGLIPEDWTWAVDDEVPTDRTAHAPYVEGQNYRLIIDGFLVSPNVDVLSAKSDDLGFVHADHNPVLALLRAQH